MLNIQGRASTPPRRSIKLSGERCQSKKPHSFMLVSVKAHEIMTLHILGIIKKVFLMNKNVCIFCLHFIFCLELEQRCHLLPLLALFCSNLTLLHKHFIKDGVYGWWRATRSYRMKIGNIMWPGTKAPCFFLFFSFWPPAKYDPSPRALCCLGIMPAVQNRRRRRGKVSKTVSQEGDLCLCKRVCFPPEITCSRFSFLLLNEAKSEPCVSAVSPVCLARARVCVATTAPAV